MVGNTCQGYGLELAMTLLDRSPRKNYAKKPNKIVISVTDGVDMCPNRTADAAKKLVNTYGAFLIEIGVGMPTSCNNYYKKFLQRIASKLGSSTDAAYYDVSNYGAIKDVTEKLFKPICDGFGTDCGPDCLGFCGCGKCFCPECKKSDSSCYDISCKADAYGKSATGCELKTIPCPVKDDICTSYVCDGKKTGNARCSAVYNQCSDKKKKNPGTCREVQCSVAKGGCYVQLNNAYCQQKHGNACLEYECTPEGQTPQFADTGCRLKSNKTITKENELKNNGKSACFKATCDPITGALGEKDLCVPSNDKCYSAACTLSSGKYACKDSDKNRPANTACKTYSCQGSKGWAIASTTNCPAQKCKNVYCDDAKGCQAEDMTGCEDSCTDEKIQSCIDRGYAMSTTSKCILGTCFVVHVSGSNYTLDCNFDNTFANCYTTKANEVKEYNAAHPSECLTPICGSNGRCTTKSIPVPQSMPKTKCMEPICRKKTDGSWDWVYEPTKVNQTCKTDACAFRVCDNNADEIKFPDGCYWEDICTNKTNECETYTCNTKGANPTCDRTPANFSQTECMKEVCVDGKKKWEFMDLYEACKEKLYIENTVIVNKCLIPTCDGQKCGVEETRPEGEDNCTIYTCDASTGLFSEKDKCVDGLFCTNDICLVDGQCIFEEIKCEDLPMEGYPCFDARCKEDPDDENNDGLRYRCVRKLNRNAYIDVCGNCIQNQPVVLPSSSSSAASASASASNSASNSDSSKSDEGNGTSSSFEQTTDAKSDSSSSSSVDLLECTGAPPRPLLTEGLAAASIALIIIFAVVIGAGIAASGVLGTKALIDRARQADNQSAHTNPLYQNNDAEMSNPAFVEAN